MWSSFMSVMYVVVIDIDNSLLVYLGTRNQVY